MLRLRLVDLYDRGLKEFATLSALEKDVFVIHDLEIYYEMEGGFEDYLLSGGHDAQVSWLSGTLARIGDAQSFAIIRDLRRLGESGRDSMSTLCDRFFDLREHRWSLLLEHLRTRGVAVEE